MPIERLQFCDNCDEETYHWINRKYTRKPRKGLEPEKDLSQKAQPSNQTKCKICKKTHVIHPPNLVRYKHFDVNIMYNQISLLFFTENINKTYQERKDDVIFQLDCCERTLDSYIQSFLRHETELHKTLMDLSLKLPSGLSIKQLIHQKEKQLQEGALMPGPRYSQQTNIRYQKASTLIAVSYSCFHQASQHLKKWFYTEQQIGEWLNSRLYKKYHCYLF